MTALPEYERLEATGLWRPDPAAQRREVIVNFGDATLVLADPRSMTALAHWSLAAAERRNPGKMPALYAPAPDAPEELELDDAVMVAAIEKLHARLAARRPRPGRLRGALLAGGLALVLGLGLFWLPGEMKRHTAAVLPPSAREEIGQAALTDLARLTGAPCGGAAEATALARLAERVAPGAGLRLVVLPEPLAGLRVLPGRIVAVGAPLLEDHETADVLAGHLLAGLARAEAADPLRPLLDFVGLGATFRLLTGGHLPEAALSGYGEVLLPVPEGELPVAALVARFAAAGVALAPYAGAQADAGRAAELRARDPFAGTVPPAPALADADWVLLQSICLR